MPLRSCFEPDLRIVVICANMLLLVSQTIPPKSPRTCLTWGRLGERRVGQYYLRLSLIYVQVYSELIRRVQHAQV